MRVRLGSPPNRKWITPRSVGLCPVIDDLFSGTADDQRESEPARRPPFARRRHVLVVLAAVLVLVVLLVVVGSFLVGDLSGYSATTLRFWTD